MTESIRVNFNRPLPVFALADTVLLPHAILPLHVFESHYRDMIHDCLDQSGQLAMATFLVPKEAILDEEQPELRPAVCVGQIVQHEGLPDGRHNVLVHGVCRARIVELEEPEDDRSYRIAKLRPLEPLTDDPPPMQEIRDSLQEILSRPRLKKLRSSSTVMEWFEREDIPTHALLELIGFTLVKSSAMKYELLAEPDPFRRAALIKKELQGIDCLVRRAQLQGPHNWPKGMSWN